MAFGKRGGQQTLAAQSAFAAAPENEPDLKRGLFGGEHDDGFDINLGFMQRYGEGKSIIVLVLMWLFLGSAGAHRFYLGHNTLGAAFLLANAFFITSFVVTLILGFADAVKGNAGADSTWGWWFGVFAILGLWYLVDGIYVICRTLSAKVGT